MKKLKENLESITGFETMNTNKMRVPNGGILSPSSSYSSFGVNAAKPAANYAGTVGGIRYGSGNIAGNASLGIGRFVSYPNNINPSGFTFGSIIASILCIF